MNDFMPVAEYQSIVRRLSNCNAEDLLNILSFVIRSRDEQLRGSYNHCDFTVLGCNGDTCDEEYHHSPSHIGIKDRIVRISLEIEEIEE